MFSSDSKNKHHYYITCLLKFEREFMRIISLNQNAVYISLLISMLLF